MASELAGWPSIIPADRATGLNVFGLFHVDAGQIVAAALFVNRGSHSNSFVHELPMVTHRITP
jgi:hypothetical protein